MNNPFKFYYEGKEYFNDNLIATRKIKKEIKLFKMKIREILEEYQHIGATDTQSKEEVIEYLKKDLGSGGFL